MDTAIYVKKNNQTQCDMHLISVRDSRHSIFYGEKTLELNSIAQGTCIKGCLLKTAAIEIH